MAIDGKFKCQMEDLFPHGAFVTSVVEPIRDFDRSTKEHPVQALDKETGMPMWEVTVQDGDPEAAKAMRSFQVKVAAKHQPVPPEAIPGTPFRPVFLEGIEVRPYVKENGAGRASIAYSVRAAGMRSAMPAGQSGSDSRRGKASGAAAEAA
ncbi:MAG: plasmid replication, integration and excision activator [Pseudonocardiaceae bacterium]